MRLHTEQGDYYVKFRYYSDTTIRDPKVTYTQRGTMCVIVRPNGFEYGGRVLCDSRRPFVKATGRKLALTKALRRLNAPRALRAELWFHYLSRLGPRGVAMALAGAKAFERHALPRREPLGFLAKPSFDTITDAARIEA